MSTHIIALILYAGRLGDVPDCPIPRWQLALRGSGHFVVPARRRPGVSDPSRPQHTNVSTIRG